MSISVIMSVYKSEKPEYLDRALCSVWNDQTLEPDEIILVKDGPLGLDLEDIITKWKLFLGEKLILIVNQENLGLTVSLNKAIKVASGDFLARMDSDDISCPERFDKQYSYMKSHPNIDVLGGGLQEIDETGKWGAKRLYPESMNEIKKYIVKANPIAHPTAFMRKKLFEEGFSYNEQYRKNQDLKLWFDLLINHRELANLNEVVLYFRRTDETYSKRSSKISLKSEAKIYMSGIRALYGRITYKQIYPIMRYVVKSMSPNVNKFVYKYFFKKTV